jgi:hypothetical protein
MSRRAVAFVTLCLACAGLSAAWFAHAATRAPRQQSSPLQVRTGAAAVAAALRVPHLLVRTTVPGPTYGEVAVLPLASPGATRVAVPIRCDRIDFAGGHGICLRTHQGVLTTYDAQILDARLRPIHTIELPGAPSRARVSPDGRWAAYTVFVSGDSYASTSFSTRTGIIDTRTGKQIGQLEQFRTLEDGKVIHAANFNFWGVTFARDGNTFYATLGTGVHTYLVRGDLARRSVTVLRDGVECPSLSPDGTRIAFKQRTSGSFGRLEWRPAVLDLATLKDHPLPDGDENLDDQIAWLDDAHVVFGLPSGSGQTAIWKVAADGSGRPQQLVADAWSPAPVAS